MQNKRKFNYPKLKKLVTIIFILGLITSSISGLDYWNKKGKWEFCGRVDNQRGYEYCIEMRNKEVNSAGLIFLINFFIGVIIPISFFSGIWIYKYLFPEVKND